MTRIIIPVENTQGLQATVCQHFGQAPYYLIIELDSNNHIKDIETKTNKSEHMGGTGNPHQTIVDYKPDIVIAYSMGPGAINVLQNAGVRIFKATSTKVQDILNDLTQNKITSKIQPCAHAHAHHHEK